jgi:hypothetical protein
VGALCLSTSAADVRYNRDIRPILSDNCFYCHGPDANKRKGKLRLDVRDSAIEKKAIIPGNAGESKLVKRIFTSDPDDIMPPPDSHKSLTPAQKELLKEWVAQGAKYEGHWAYLAPMKTDVPSGKNGIDYLVAERLKRIGLTPSSEADKRTLARRLYFDLIGLPPKPEEVEAFEKDGSPEAYANLVEKLLASEHYGERLAIPWLDVVRFADTIGYHSDNPRNIWPYRDYVIKAFNENKPFDQFTREQLAGDLLPNSTQEQKVASAFNRLLLSTEEGGAQPKDYEARMLTDRVRAIGTVWLGQTIGCAQCHDHKFDPITQRDFYSMGAFFADIKEPIIGRREDGILVPDAKQKAELARLQSEAEDLQKKYDEPHSELAEAFSKWEAAQTEALTQDRLWTHLKPAKAQSEGGAKLATQSDDSVLVSGKNPEKDTYSLEFPAGPNPISALRLEALPDDSLPSKGPGRAKNGNFVLTEVIARIHRANGDVQTLSLSAARADFEQGTLVEKNPYKAWTAASVIDGDARGEELGWAILPEVNKPHQLVLEFAQPVRIEKGDNVAIELKQNHGNGSHNLGHFRISASSSYDVARGPLAPTVPKHIADLVSVPSEQRTQEQKDKLFSEFKAVAPELGELRKNLADAKKAKSDFETTIPRCIVSLSSDQPRTVRILPRGNFLIETGEIVKPALPGYLHASSENGNDALTRLDLANFIVSKDNPLTARVTMNRLWKQFFGMGLSKVLDDLGAQGEPPPNQELLDWLACEFMDSGWDIKHMVRLMVNSHTYKQTSTPSKELRARDPYNRELAVQSRWRLDAELVRDNALAISGLLVNRLGGPSVKPYQPDGYWENLNFPVRSWDASKGEDQYRRGLYTWWQRSYMHPSLLAFDAPTREECAAERNRSNIPQQALVLLNDPTYVEASRSFAARILKEGGSDASTRIKWAIRQALDREVRSDELEVLQPLLEKNMGIYKSDAAAAEALLKVGYSPMPDGLDHAELAAWTNVARVILNLHETITRS